MKEAIANICMLTGLETSLITTCINSCRWILSAIWFFKLFKYLAVHRALFNCCREQGQNCASTHCLWDVLGSWGCPDKITYIEGWREEICQHILRRITDFSPKDVLHQLAANCSAEFCPVSYLLKESCFLAIINLINQIAANVTKDTFLALSCCLSHCVVL